MRRTMVGIVLLTAFVVVPFTAFAQSMNLWVGTWKANVATSKVDPAGPPPPTSLTVTVDIVNGVARLTGDLVNAQGQKSHQVNLVTFDGNEHPLVGEAQPTTRTYKWVDDRTFEWVTKVNGQVTGTTRDVLSRDGKTATVTTTGKNPQGKAFKAVTLFEKQ